MKVRANRSLFTGLPLDCFDPIKLKLIGSTMRTGLVPPTNSAQTPPPKLGPVGADTADKVEGNEQEEKERLPFSVKQNQHFNDGLCLDATHNKPALRWLPSGSRRRRRRSWHR